MERHWMNQDTTMTLPWRSTKDSTLIEDLAKKILPTTSQSASRRSFHQGLAVGFPGTSGVIKTELSARVINNSDNWRDLQGTWQCKRWQDSADDWVQEALSLQRVQVRGERPKSPSQTFCASFLGGVPDNPDWGRGPPLPVYLLGRWVRRIPRAFPWILFHDNLAGDQRIFL